MLKRVTTEKRLCPGDILKRCLEVTGENSDITTIDITGGAPEMNPFMKDFIREAAVLGKRLIVRSNLVILTEDDYSGMPDFTPTTGLR